MLLNNTYLNILCSFAKIGMASYFTQRVNNLSQQGVINVMIDSGAYTLHNAKFKPSHITLDNYCSYLEKNQSFVEKYVNLDVIGNERESKINYEIMLRRGFNPMFVFTIYDKDFNYLKAAVKNNPDLCVAGGVSTKGDWMTKRFQDVFLTTKAKIHGLGYVTYPKIFQLPLHSVDSSSWAQLAYAYGFISYFDNGLKSTWFKDIIQRKKKLPVKAQLVLEKLKVTPQEFSNLEYHKGHQSLNAITVIMAFLDYQRFAKQNGVDLFLAVSNLNQLNSIIYINENYNNGTLTYEKFRGIDFTSRG